MKKTTLSQRNTPIKRRNEYERRDAVRKWNSTSLIFLSSLVLLLCGCTQTTRVSTSHQSNSTGIYVFTIYLKNNSGTIQVGISKLDAQTHKLLWHSQPALSYGAAGTEKEQLAVAGDTAYLSFTARLNLNFSNNVVYAFNTKDGKELWHTASKLYAYSGNMIPFRQPWLITPTAESVYIVSSEGTVSALNAKNGSLRWTYDPKIQESVCSPQDGQCNSQINQLTIVDNTIYGSVKNRFYALDATKGTPLWSHDLPSDQIIEQPLALDGNLVYIAACGQRTCFFNAYTANNGSAIWHTVEPHYDLRQFTIWNHKIYVVSLLTTAIFGTIMVNTWNSMDGKPLWHYEGDSGNVLIANNEIYIEQIGSYNSQTQRFMGTILALDPTTGTTRWQSTQSNEASILRAVADTTIFAYNQDTIFAYKTSDGNKIWHYSFAPIPGFQSSIITIVVIPSSS